MTARKQMTMVAILMQPIYASGKQSAKVKNLDQWWGSVFDTCICDNNIANCVVSRYMSGERYIPQKYIQYYADQSRAPKKLIDGVYACLSTYYQSDQLLRDVYGILIEFVQTVPTVDQCLLMPSSVPVDPNRDETAHLWAVLLMYAMTMDACRALLANKE